MMETGLMVISMVRGFGKVIRAMSILAIGLKAKQRGLEFMFGLTVGYF